MTWNRSICVLLMVIISFVPVNNAQSFTSFGYDLLSVYKSFSNGNTEIRIVFRAPTNTETYWTLDFIPILANDRFSSIRTTRNNNVYTSLLTSSKSTGTVSMYSYSFHPFLVKMTVILYMSTSGNSGTYQQDCSYRKPVHTGYSVDLDFWCNTNASFHADSIMWFVRNQSSDYEKQVYLRGPFGDMILGGEQLFDMQTTESGNRIQTVLTPRDMTRVQRISLVSLYGPHFFHWRGPVREVRFQIEDDVDLDGTSPPLYEQNVGVTRFFFTPIPLAETKTGGILCEAYGNPAPTVEINKVKDNGEASIPGHPSHVFQTRYSTLITLIINYPSEHDGGNYTCTARSGDKVHVARKLVWFQPPPEFDTSATTKVTDTDSVTITMRVTGLSPFTVECFENSIGGQKLGNDEVQLSNTIRRVTFTRRYQTTEITITINSSRPQPQKVVCKAKDKWIGESTNTVDLLS